jgi:hypothetical protein
LPFRGALNELIARMLDVAEATVKVRYQGHPAEDRRGQSHPARHVGHKPKHDDVSL